MSGTDPVRGWDDRTPGQIVQDILDYKAFLEKQARSGSLERITAEEQRLQLRRRLDALAAELYEEDSEKTKDGPQ